MSEMTGKSNMNPSADSYTMRFSPDFDMVRVGYAAYDAKTTFEGKAPSMYVVVHNQAYYADVNGNLWACTEYTREGGFDWNMGFNMNVAMGAEYGANVPPHIEAYLLHVCLMVWDAIISEFPIEFNGGR